MLERGRSAHTLRRRHADSDGERGPHRHPTASPRLSPTALPTLSSAEAEAKAELQAYRDAWRTDGAVAASRAYLAIDQQVSNGAEGLRLVSGTVTRVTDAQPTPDGLRLGVTLDLSFDGSSGAWGEELDDRFVTFTRRSGGIPYEMSFATSP